MQAIDVNEPSCFMHQLTEALTAIDGWAQLSLMSVPENEPGREPLVHLRDIVEQTMVRVRGFVDLQQQSKAD